MSRTTIATNQPRMSANSLLPGQASGGDAMPMSRQEPSVQKPSGEWTLQWLNPAVEKDAVIWDEALAAYPEAGVFHRSAWARVLQQTYKHKPRYLHLLHHGTSAAMVPLMEVRSLVTGARGVSLPFSDSCTPLVRDPEAMTQVTKALEALAITKGWKHFELRGAQMEADTPASETFAEHVLHLDRCLEEVEGGYTASVSRAIRKAERNLVSVEIDMGWDALQNYYLLHARTRRRHGLPPQSFTFFRQLYREIISNNLGFIALAWHQERPIAGAVFLVNGPHAVYKYGASDSETWELRPNNLVMRDAIRHLHERGTATLSFGRTDLPDAGLRRFKQGWGTRETTLSYYQYLTEAAQWATQQTPREGFLAGIHKPVFRRMPLVLNRLAGAALYPHLD